MAWTYLGLRGSASSKASGTWLQVSPTVAIPAGSLVVLCVAGDDKVASPTWGPVIYPQDSLGGGEADWSFLGHALNRAGAATASDGVIVGMWGRILPAELGTEGHVACWWDGAVAARSITIYAFSADRPVTRAYYAEGAIGTGTAATVSAAGLDEAEYLFLGLTGIEGPNGDAFTVPSGWIHGTDMRQGTNGGGAATNVATRFGYRILRGTGAAWTPTLGASRRHGSVIGAFAEVPAAEEEETVPGDAVRLVGGTYLRMAGGGYIRLAGGGAVRAAVTYADGATPPTSLVLSGGHTWPEEGTDGTCVSGGKTVAVSISPRGVMSETSAGAWTAAFSAQTSSAPATLTAKIGRVTGYEAFATPEPPNAGGPYSPAFRAAIDAYARPYGAAAPWNLPVAGIPLDPESDMLARKLWDDAFIDRPERNFNFGQVDYTYPVYVTRPGMRSYPVVTTTGWGNLNGASIPYDPSWAPAPGEDAQIIILDPATGREWNLFKVQFDGTRITIYNGNLVPGDYRVKTDGFVPSRGIGIQYLAMLVRPEEVARGKIEHALSLPVRNSSGLRYVAPATKLEHPGLRLDGIPEGTRYSLDVTYAEIDAHVSGLPVSAAKRRGIRAMIVAMKDYGWFITDTAGGTQFQMEAMTSAGSKWAELDMVDAAVGGRVYPKDALDNLITRKRIVAHVPSDAYGASAGKRAIHAPISASLSATIGSGGVLRQSGRG